MKRITMALAIVFALGLTAQTASAGSAHFVGTPTITASGSTATVSGKVAGLGNITQISVIVTAEAACVNPGTHKPKAANKQTVTASGDFPVQNGKADFSLTATATFQPDCSPPMTVVWTLIKAEAYTGCTDVNGVPDCTLGTLVASYP